jgi:hypothetical protein
MKVTRKSQRRKTRKAKKVQCAQRAKRSPRGKLKRAIRKFLPDRIFSCLETHGNTEWSLSVLPFVALFFALSNESTLGERYDMAKDVAAFWFPNEFLATTYRGFIKALVRHNGVLVQIVSDALRTQMLLLAGADGKIAGLIPFVVDGSKVAAPWTRANEEKLGKKGRKPKGETCRRQETDLRPQLTLTMLWHVPLGLPWAWKHGGLAEGERTQFRDLLNTLPRHALIVADAGFVGYQLWNTIQGGGRHFLIRVGANVELLRSLVPGCDIQRDGEIVWLWPDGQRTQQAPPLKLRLITIQKGQQTWHLVTSLLDPESLSETQASILYSKRWGVECCFRTLKQTYECGKMRSHTPHCAGAELDWSLLSLWLVSLLAQQELREAKINPERHSPAGARKLVRRELHRQSEGKEQLDVSEFQTAVKDSYNRTSSKKARHDQRKKHAPPPSAPKLTKATKRQRQAARALEQSPGKAA